VYVDAPRPPVEIHLYLARYTNRPFANGCEAESQPTLEVKDASFSDRRHRLIGSHLVPELSSSSVLCTAGRDGAGSHTSDGHLNVKLSTPGTQAAAPTPCSFLPLVGRLVF
jgi:hypothetical protein